MLSLIYARSRNHCIGRNGQIPWRLPDDFAHFKKTTMGCPIIMGRKTYEDHSSALPGRLNIVVTRQADYIAADGVVVVSTLEAALKLAYENNNDIFVIGGVAFFTEAFEFADCVYETIVDTDIEGDAFLPQFDFGGWETSLMSEHQADEKHKHPFTIYCHKRIGPSA